MAALALVVSDCSSESESELNNSTQASVTVRVDGFSISQEDLPTTRATAVGSYPGVQSLTLAF